MRAATCGACGCALKLDPLTNRHIDRSGKRHPVKTIREVGKPRRVVCVATDPEAVSA